MFKKLKLAVVSHKNCTDGKVASAVMAYFLRDRDVSYFEATYQSGIVDELIATGIKFDKIWAVDFSFTAEQLDQLTEALPDTHITVIDHHKTAVKEYQSDKFDVVFNKDKSGALLAWEYWTGVETPKVLKLVQDRDLWQWKFPETKAVSAYLYSLSLEETRELLTPHFGFMYEVGFKATDKIFTGRLEFKGQALLYIQQQEIDAQLAQEPKSVVFVMNDAERSFVYGIGYESGKNVSEVCSALLKANEELNDRKYDFAFMTFKVEGDKHVCSLRSVGDFDVSEIAKMYGGGGHKNAAGFKVDHELVLFTDPDFKNN